MFALCVTTTANSKENKFFVGNNDFSLEQPASMTGENCDRVSSQKRRNGFRTSGGSGPTSWLVNLPLQVGVVDLVSRVGVAGLVVWWIWPD